MKKVMTLLVASCLMVLVSSFNSPTYYSEEEDFTRYSLQEAPKADVLLDAYDCLNRISVSVVLCPGTGYKCVAKLKIGDGYVYVSEQKGAGRGNVEIY